MQRQADVEAGRMRQAGQDRRDSENIKHAYPGRPVYRDPGYRSI